MTKLRFDLDAFDVAAHRATKVAQGGLSRHHWAQCSDYDVIADAVGDLLDMSVKMHYGRIPVVTGTIDLKAMNRLRRFVLVSGGKELAFTGMSPAADTYEEYGSSYVKSWIELHME